mmetsp:Transcript_24854/g.79493  ORF Transcript_24854/g.79493 Transcript_24854/m.79493 type:complete len:225 (-) Transcript_24854:25-699(-)
MGAKRSVATSITCGACSTSREPSTSLPTDAGVLRRYTSFFSCSKGWEGGSGRLALRNGELLSTKLTLTPSSWCRPKTDLSPSGKGVPVTHQTRRARRCRWSSTPMLAPPSSSTASWHSSRMSRSKARACANASCSSKTSQLRQMCSRLAMRTRAVPPPRPDHAPGERAAISSLFVTICTPSAPPANLASSDRHWWQRCSGVRTSAARVEPSSRAGGRASRSAIS